jgi:cytochrome c-type biogenesis protein CcmH
MSGMPTWLWGFVAGMATVVALATAWLTWAANASLARGDAKHQRRWTWGVVLGVPLLVVVLYAQLGHPVAANPALHRHANDSAETMVSKLASRLQADPDQPQGWLMLGRSYQVLGRYGEAAQAYERAELLALQDVDVLTDWVESRMQAANGHFDPRSLHLLARAQALQPEHEAVLLLSGLAALDQGDRRTARAQLEKLLAVQPEGSPDHQAVAQALAQLAQGQDPRRPPLAPSQP